MTVSAAGYKRVETIRQATEFTPNMWAEAEGKLSGDQRAALQAGRAHGNNSDVAGAPPSVRHPVSNVFHCAYWYHHVSMHHRV